MLIILFSTKSEALCTHTRTRVHVFTTNRGSNRPKKRSKNEENKKTMFKNIIISKVLRGGKTIQHVHHCVCIQQGNL